MSAGPERPAAGLTGEPADPADDPRVLRAIREYEAAVAAGKRPGRSEFLARHAEVAGPLAECLDALEFLHAAAPRLDGSPVSRPVTASSASARSSLTRAGSHANSPRTSPGCTASGRRSPLSLFSTPCTHATISRTIAATSTAIPRRIPRSSGVCGGAS